MKFLKKKDLMTPEKRLNEVLRISKFAGNTGEKPQHALPQLQLAFWELNLQNAFVFKHGKAKEGAPKLTPPDLSTCYI